MKILGQKPLHQVGNGKRVYLTMWEQTYEHNGREGRYFSVCRGESYPAHEYKLSDAVIIVPVLENPGEERKLVMTSEFRIPIGCRELGFPAGLIDPKDYDETNDPELAAACAACREVYEETGFNFEVTEVSPPNLYSSAGMSNESVTIVFGKATGVASNKNLETSEDIEVRLFTRADLVRFMADPEPNLALSKSAWPFMWAFAKYGF